MLAALRSDGSHGQWWARQFIIPQPGCCSPLGMEKQQQQLHLRQPVLLWGWEGEAQLSSGSESEGVRLTSVCGYPDQPSLTTGRELIQPLWNSLWLSGSVMRSDLNNKGELLVIPLVRSSSDTLKTVEKNKQNLEKPKLIQVQEWQQSKSCVKYW